MRKRRSTIAVVGGDGFVGSQVLRRLATMGLPIRGSLRPGRRRWHIDDIDCQWVPIDLETPAAVRRLVRHAGTVIHCGGYNPRRALQIDDAKKRGVRQIRILLDACMTEGVARVVYVSSAVTAMQADQPDQPFDETSRYVPGSVENAYFEAKAAMETELYRYVAAGLDAVIANPTLVVGPGEAQLGTGALIRAVAGGRLPVAPEQMSINIVDVRDLAAGIVAAMQRGRRGRRYILGGANGELAELIELTAQLSHRHIVRRGEWSPVIEPVARVGERLIEWCGCNAAPPLLVPLDLVARGGAFSSRRAEAELGFSCRELRSTVADTLEWLSRVGYLSWADSNGHRRRGLNPRRHLLDQSRSFC